MPQTTSEASRSMSGSLDGSIDAFDLSSGELHTPKKETKGVKRLFTTRKNSDYKWQRARGVVGALEVKSEPRFKPKDDMIKRKFPKREKAFADALMVWDQNKLRESFIKACDELPNEYCCCGLMISNDDCVKESVKTLNREWCPEVNQKILEHGFKIDCFLWHWPNPSGKAETNILLIRFYELSSYRFAEASKSNIDFELVSQDSDDDDDVLLDAVEEVQREEMARS
jgi:hypothetical protein